MDLLGKNRGGGWKRKEKEKTMRTSSLVANTLVALLTNRWSSSLTPLFRNRVSWIGDIHASVREILEPILLYAPR